MKTPTILTERLILRPLTQEDTKNIYDCWMQDNDVAKYMYWHASKNIVDTIDFVKYELSMVNDEKWYRFLIVRKEDNKLVGTCLIYFNIEENNWDISYNLGKEYWHNGYTYEAMSTVLDFGIKTLGIKKVIAIHAVENVLSMHVITRLGFKYVKDVEYFCNGGTIRTTGKYYEYIV